MYSIYILTVSLVYFISNERMDREHFDAFYEKDAIVGNRITK